MMQEEQQETLVSQPQSTGSDSAPDWKFLTTIDEEGLCIANKESYFTPMLNLYFAFGMLLLAAGVFLSFFSGMLFFSVVWVVLGTLVLASRQKLPDWMISTQLKKLEAVYHTRSICFALVFWPQGLSITNRLTSGRTNLRYECFSRIVRNDDYLMLITRDRKCVVVHLDDVENHEDFVEYIRSRCPNARFKTHKN